MSANAEWYKQLTRDTSENYLLLTVSRGRTPGLFINWLTCNESKNWVKKDAEVKGFNSLDGAKQYLEEAGTFLGNVQIRHASFSIQSAALIQSLSPIGYTSEVVFRTQFQCLIYI